MKKIVFFYFLFLYSISTVSQVICDSITRLPIENISIISNKNLGTITNTEGVFSLDYFNDSKVLNFSHLAYQSKSIEKINFKESDTVFLNAITIKLDEIVLENFNAKDTILKVIDRIPTNYSFKPFNLFGFYRESLMEDKIGVSMTEVSFMTENKELNSNYIYNTEIIKGRRSENHTAFGLDIIGGVIATIQQGDMVRQKRRFFDVKNISKYNFEYGGSIEESEGNVTYIINCEPSNDDIYNDSFGQLYIDSKTLAITQIKTNVDENKIKKVLENLNPKIFKSKKAVYLLKTVEGIIKYKKINDKYYLSFITLMNGRKGILKGVSHNYELNFKLIITNINTKNVKTINTNYNPKKGFNKQVKKIPSMEYWNENNTLYFSKKEKKILNDIKNAHK